MANFFTSDGRSQIENIIPQYCQLGTGVVNYLADTTEGNNQFYNLEIPLTRTQYGRNLRRKVLSKSQITNVTNFDSLDRSTYTESTGLFLQIPKSAITIKRNSGANIRIVLDKYTANGNTLREIGLFTGGLSLDGSNKLLLSCYKQFPPIAKTNEFSLIFDWTIQATDFNSVLVWQTEEEYSSTIGDTNTGGGGPKQTQPIFTYLYGAGSDRWNLTGNLINFPALVPRQNPANSFEAGTFGFTSESKAIADASGLSVCAVNGAVSAVNTAPPQVGVGTVYVSAQPTNSNFSPYTAALAYEFSTGKTSTDLDSTYLGQIQWKIPEGAPLNTSTVIRCVVPTSSGDFDSAVWGNYINWVISGVEESTTLPFSSSGIVAQIERVQNNPSGGYETVEVIFPTVVRYTPGLTQTYDIYTTSNSNTNAPPVLDSSAFINIKVKDLSGNIYAIDDVDLFTSGNLAASSLLKSGPYLRTYKFVYRLKPQATASPLFPDPSNIEHRPYGLTAYVYITVKKYDPTYKIDIRIANGLYMMPNGGWGGLGNDGVAAVKTIGGTNPINQPRNILGNFYYASLWMEHSGDLSAVHNTETYNVTRDSDYFDETGTEKVFLVSPYAALGETKYGWNDNLTFEQNVQWKCHMFPKQKHFSRRFCLIPKSFTIPSPPGSYNTTFAKQLANYGDIAFGTRGRSFYNIPKWGPVGDLAPNYATFSNPPGAGGFQGIFSYKEKWEITRRENEETWNLPGVTLKDSFAYLYKEKFNDLELVSKTEDWNWNGSRPANSANANQGTLGEEEIYFAGGFRGGDDGTTYDSFVGTVPPGIANNKGDHREKAKMPYKTKLPFNTLGKSDPDDGGLAFLNFYPGGTLTNAELNYMGLKCQYISQRIPWIYNVSGIPITVGDVMNAYSFTPTTSPADVQLEDYFYLTYHGKATDENKTKFWTLPLVHFAWKSNSKVVEPNENLIRLDPVTNPGYISNIFSGVNNTIGKQLTNKCPYSYKVATFTPDPVLIDSYDRYGIGAASKIFGREHISRIYPVLMTQCQLTNDSFLKDEFEMFASLCAHTYPPYPTTVRTMAIFPNANKETSYLNRFTGSQKYLSLVSGVNASGNGFVFQNSRGTVHPVAAMAGYYSFASNSWKQHNEAALDYIASGFHNAWIRENGHIGCDYIDKEGSPRFGGILKALKFGHTLSSIPTDPKKVPWINYALANSAPYSVTGGNNVLAESELPQITTQKGNFFAASTLGDQAFMLSYQSIAFSMLAKHVLRYRKPNLYNSLLSSVNIQASSMAFDVFDFVSGVVGVSDIGKVLKDSQNTDILSIFNTNQNGNTFTPLMSGFTKNGKALSGTVNGVNLATDNNTNVLAALQSVPDNEIINYMSPVDPTKVLGGFPNIVATITDYATINAAIAADGGHKYRGSKKSLASPVIPRQGFSGVDYDTKNLRGDEVRYLDCHSFFSNGLMANKNWELSALDTSNAFIPIIAMIGNNYYDSYENPFGNINSYANQADKTALINAAINNCLALIKVNSAINLVGPVLAYLNYLYQNNGT
jgi:hypothetical protein